MLSGYRISSSGEVSTPYTEEDAFETLISIREELTHRMQTHNVPEDKLWAAYQQQDTEQLARLLELSSEELEVFNHRLQIATNILLQKYPALQQARDHTQILEILNLRNTGMKVTTSNEPDCDWGPYTACLVGSALASGGNALIYFLGSYVCLCGFCRGGYVETLCTRD